MTLEALLKATARRCAIPYEKCTLRGVSFTPAADFSPSGIVALVPLASCLSPRASRLVPLASCLSPRASRLVPLAFFLQRIDSITSAIPWPPPMHMVISPYRSARRLSA